MGTRSETPGSGVWVGAGSSERPKLGRPARRSRSREVLGLRTPASASSPLRPEEEDRLQQKGPAFPGRGAQQKVGESGGQTPDPSLLTWRRRARVGPGPSPRAAAPGTAAVSTESGPRVPPPPRPAPPGPAPRELGGPSGPLPARPRRREDAPAQVWAQVSGGRARRPRGRPLPTRGGGARGWEPPPGPQAELGAAGLAGRPLRAAQSPSVPPPGEDLRGRLSARGRPAPRGAAWRRRPEVLLRRPFLSLDLTVFTCKMGVWCLLRILPRAQPGSPCGAHGRRAGNWGDPGRQS